MKNKYALLYALTLFSLVVTAVSLVFLPARIPAHYSASGEINRIGSKYEQLIFPAVTAGMGAFFIILAKYQAKKGSAANEKVLLVTGAATLAFFDLMTVYFIRLAFSYVGGSAAGLSANKIYTLSSVGIGAMLCVLGNIMPKARLNALFGLRTAWSMKNERVWRKSQRFGGISLFICGIAVIISSLFFNGIACLYATLALLIADATVSVIASYRFYEKDLAEHPEEK